MRVGARPAVRRVSTIILLSIKMCVECEVCAQTAQSCARETERVFARYLESSLTTSVQWRAVILGAAVLACAARSANFGFWGSEYGGRGPPARPTPSPLGVAQLSQDA